MQYPLIISSKANIYYYTGLHSSNALLVIYKEEMVLITDFRYEQAAKATGCKTVVTRSGQDIFDAALELLDELKSDIVVYEDYDLLTRDFLRFAEKYKMQPVAEDFAGVRAIKDQNEFNKMLTASKIASAAFDKVYEEISQGVSEKAVAALLDFYMKLEGADGTSFDTIVAFDANASMPHHQPDDTVLKPGDCVLIDMGARYMGYCSDMTRTFFFGEADDESSKIYEVVLQAQKKALEAVRAGVSCSELDGVARGYIEQMGYGDSFGHGLGHGVGLEIHEYPKVNARSEDVLETGMVITIEPGIYIPGKTGVRIEDMVLVTKDGHINMTVTDKKLKIK